MIHRDIEQPQSPAVHPSEIGDRYLLQRQSVLDGALIVESLLTPPDEVEVSALTHHSLLIHLSEGSTRQVNRFDGDEYDGPVPKGSIFLAPAGIPAFWSWETTDQGVGFVFESTLLQQRVSDMDCLNPDQVELRSIPIVPDPQLEAIACRFKHEMEAPAIASSLYMDSLANFLIVHLLRTYCIFQPKIQSYADGLSKQKLQSAIAYIHDHLADDISLSAIATCLGISQYYFCRLFKQSTGMAPHQYLLQQRIKRAKELLACRHLSLVEVASLVGFSNQSHFTTQFRKLTGTTPKSYRNSL
ncbi:MAG: helix-turn-helix domain-containing protein [Leptolyngbya sp. BL-A-14]